MTNEAQIWKKVLDTVLKMPGVKVDRIAFLRKELRPYCNQSRLQMIGSVRPYTVVSEDVIDALARQCIRYHTALATTASTIVGLPGGLAMAATMPADITQFFYHVVVISQKLAYLYGYPDFFEIPESPSSPSDPSAPSAPLAPLAPSAPESPASLSSPAADLLTIFIGVMMGAPVAEKGIAELSKAVGENAVTRLPRVALTKGALFPIVSQVAKMIGTRLSKESFAKGVGRFIPLAGGLFSGGLTFYSFRKGANRLRRQLRAQRHLFDDGAISDFQLGNLKTSFVKAGLAERQPLLVEKNIIEAMINLAKINDDVSPDKFHAIEHRIACAKISPQDKLDLLAGIDNEQSYDVDFDLLAADTATALTAIEAMTELVRQEEKLTMAEKIYLNMAAQKLGIDKQKLEELLKNAM